jgi:antitoxin YefM
MNGYPGYEESSPELSLSILFILPIDVSSFFQRLDLDVHICTLSCTEGDMTAMTYTAARANLAKTMDRVVEDHDPIIITRNGEQSVVLLSLDDYQALEETAFLLRTPANAIRLLESIEQLSSGKGQLKELDL